MRTMDKMIIINVLLKMYVTDSHSFVIISRKWQAEYLVIEEDKMQHALFIAKPKATIQIQCKFTNSHVNV